MNCVAVNAQVEAFLSAGVAKALYEDEDGGGLVVVEARVMANHHIVVLDVDVGHLVRVERRDVVTAAFHVRCRAAALVRLHSF